MVPRSRDLTQLCRAGAASRSHVADMDRRTAPIADKEPQLQGLRLPGLAWMDELLDADLQPALRRVSANSFAQFP